MFSSIPRARSENQNSSPDWIRIEAKIATNTVGTAAITENKATSRVCSRPVPIPRRSARALASRRASNTISAIAGIKLATSSSAISGGESNVPGAASRTSTVALNATIATSKAPQPQVA